MPVSQYGASALKRMGSAVAGPTRITWDNPAHTQLERQLKVTKNSFYQLKHYLKRKRSSATFDLSDALPADQLQFSGARNVLASLVEWA